MADWDSGAATTGADHRDRCAWATAREHDDALLAYHDHEWGTPTRSERDAFEALTLGIFQAGLGWLTVFHKRAAFRAAFHDFDPVRVAQMDDADVAVLLQDPGIIRNEAKIRSTLRNASVVVASESALSDLAFGVRPAAHQRPSPGSALPSHTAESEALSRRLKAEGYVFIGPTSAYAFMQAIGVVNDHVVGCFRGDELER